MFGFLVQMKQLGPTPMGWGLATTMGKGPGESRNFCISNKLPGGADTAGPPVTLGLARVLIFMAYTMLPFCFQVMSNVVQSSQIHISLLTG